MKVNFTARHYKATEKLKEYAENSVQKLERYWNGIIDCDIITDYIKNKQEVEILLKISGSVIKSHAISDDVYKSIDEAVNKLEVQLKKHKDKKSRK